MKKPRFAEKLSAALRRGKPAPASENSAASAKAPPAPRSGASLPARALLAALFAFGIFAGYCLCAAFESALMSAALDADLASARAVARRAPSFANAGRSGGIDEFTKENPFGADVRAAAETEKKGAAKASPETLKSLTLRGTLPGVGAWIDVSGNTRLVLKGQSVEGFTLSDIKYSEALLSDGAGEHSLYLLLSGGGDKTAASGDRSRRRTRRSNAPRRQTERRAPAKQELDFSGLEPASEGQEGAVPRELVDALLMNPYDELAKVRMVPTPDMSGMRLESLASDSVLARVGVAQGDHEVRSGADVDRLGLERDGAFVVDRVELAHGEALVGARNAALGDQRIVGSVIRLDVTVVAERVRLRAARVLHRMARQVEASLLVLGGMAFHEQGLLHRQRREGDDVLARLHLGLGAIQREQQDLLEDLRDLGNLVDRAFHHAFAHGSSFHRQ